MKLLLIDDHACVRVGLKELLHCLDTALDCVELTCCEQAIDPAFCFQPDLIMLDLDLPGINGLMAVQTIRERFPDSTLCIISATKDPSFAYKSIACGAAGFVPKTLEGVEIVDALRKIMSGGIYLPKGIAETYVPSGQVETTVRALQVLTPRQRQILWLAIQGKSNKRIALELGIAESTVKVHVSRAYSALGERNRAGAFFRLSQLGYCAELPDFGRIGESG